MRHVGSLFLGHGFGYAKERGLGMLIRFNVFRDVNIEMVSIARLPIPNCLTSLSTCFRVLVFPLRARGLPRARLHQFVFLENKRLDNSVLRLTDI